MANDDAVKLLEMKNKIEQAETKPAQLQGRLDGINERLKNEFSIISLTQADKELAKMEKELDKMEAELKAGIDEIEQEFQKMEV